MSILIGKNLLKIYKNREIVKNITIEVKSGEIVGLLGPNGAGKTTAFYIMVGIIQLDSGNILIDNKDISLLPLHKKSKCGIGYLPQEACIFRRLSVYNNIMAILEIRKDLNLHQRKEHIENLMEEFSLKHIQNSIGFSLSGGERRRVEIARAVAANPKFILLDEPFAGVDPISVLDIKKIIKHLSNNGLGILITDHNVRETLDVCERAYIVNQGTIIAHGTPSMILKNEQVKRVYLGDNFRL
ncbi:Lipopolysaccharide export system ATP-binding protein LptB [Candidatus Providencia siddallii]|uniref:Lipopolysaccharide export system ATP-binding protein LptB n=1 Tax=Candidatus Providencia siddallii TaxID=1715285 RepID=A0A0M6W6Y6_9GAMM|nr:Lipopolysaccharide export system ATP-binding protein LptB [Candidatus Providencia siddallii]